MELSVLLSIGYGPDTPGATTMSMNFGPLNRKGGQRRLNVAITRATSEVVIFASFDPSMMSAIGGIKSLNQDNLFIIK